MKRTDYCGAFREKDIGRSVTAMGWVQTKRDMGGVIFIDLRDREGILQVVFNAQNLSSEDFEEAERLRNETVISVIGEIRLRDDETRNPKLETGTVELAAHKISIISEADPIPFSIEEGGKVREDLRLKYRYLDIRRPELLNRLRYRHLVSRIVHEYLDGEGFIEVETPVLTKSTPEGARDYLVPSRVHQGAFYALPQSPQIFKQLLMVGGIDKYYQFARCFRDEDLRADRQPEFTQVDMEMSFVDQDDILEHLEKLFKYIFKTIKGIDFTEPFPRLTWQEAMDRYGSDKPDLRFDLPIVDLTGIMRQCSFSVFRDTVDRGGTVRAINVKGRADFTRGAIEELTQKAVSFGAKGMAWIAIREDGELYSVLTKYFTEAEMEQLLRAVDGKPGDFILFCADKFNTVCRTLGGLRLYLADMLELRKKDDYRFLLVTDFPEFEYSEEEKRYIATHHPFTMPYPEDIQYMTSDPAKVRSQAYDVVLNGIELGSGSIRIHRKDIQQKMFEALGFTQEETRKRFGFMIDAFRYGTPPHGGFAFGLDRLVMLMTDAESLRDIIAFPKIKDASCPMTDAPGMVDPAQLELLGLNMVQNEAGSVKTQGRKPVPTINVDNVALLSKLYLTDEEKVSMEREMQDIIAFANQLDQIDTSGIPVTAHIMPIENVFRKDVPMTSFKREQLLENTPEKQDGYIFVPQVIE
ncbi:MAG TPA: aspartate--tRNA ligase [Clostridia bacterium]|nr:aspartate--tRNA ligase [Clostridia bacterium]